MNERGQVWAARLAMILTVTWPGACGTVSVDEDASARTFSQRAPSWAIHGRSPKFPLTRYLVGNGLSSSALPADRALEEARTNALAEIAHQIETHVVSAIQSRTRDVTRNESSWRLAETETLTKLQANEDLGGVARFLKYYDEPTGTGAVLAAVDRRRLADRFRGQAIRRQKECAAYIDSLEKQGPPGDVAAGLKLLLRAQAALVMALAGEQKAAAVATGKRPRESARQLDDIWKRVADEYGKLVGPIRVEVITGDGQRVGFSGSAKRPITVRVTGRSGRPVAGFPMIVYRKVGEDVSVLHRGATDRTGSFTFRLKGLVVTGSAANTADVALDFQAVAEASTWIAPAGRITYIMPTRPSARVAVIVDERIDGRPRATSSVATAIEDRLAKLEFQVVDPGLDLPARTVVGLTADQLIQRFGKACDYVVVGLVDARRSSEHRDIVFYKCHSRMRALEVESGGVIACAVAREKTKAGGRKSQASQVAEDSLSRAGARLVEALGRRFVERFDVPGSGWASENPAER